MRPLSRIGWLSRLVYRPKPLEPLKRAAKPVVGGLVVGVAKVNTGYRANSLG